MFIYAVQRKMKSIASDFAARDTKAKRNQMQSTKALRRRKWKLKLLFTVFSLIIYIKSCSKWILRLSLSTQVVQPKHINRRSWAGVGFAFSTICMTTRFKHKWQKKNNRKCDWRTKKSRVRRGNSWNNCEKTKFGFTFTFWWNWNAWLDV